MADTQLVLIPSPGAGHLFAAVELVNLLVVRDDRLSVAVLVMRSPVNSSKNPSATTDNSFTSAVDPKRVQFIDLPQEDTFGDINSPSFIFRFIESNKQNVTRAVAELASQPRRLVGFVLDLFCTTLIDVADSLGIPSYVFFTGNAAFLELMFYMQEQTDRHGKNMVEYKDTDIELDFPGFVRPLPAKVLPSIVLLEETVDPFLGLARRFRRTRGIIVNTFLELEPTALKFLCSEQGIPKVYPIGPILSVGDDTKKRQDADEVLKWLDEQPAASVVFLCFGSMGSFGEEQVREIAVALEKSGHRFLWSIRQQTKEMLRFPSDYGKDLPKVLPKGFLERTAKVGKVIGWAPQAQVLAHQSTGGFVSHCGWNSTLESIWFGVPTAAWPLYAEQQFNAFQLVKELGLAVEIRIDYRRNFFEKSADFVSADEIELGIRELMEGDGGQKRRKKVMELSGISRNVMKEEGSSYLAFGEFIHDLSDNNGITN